MPIYTARRPAFHLDGGTFIRNAGDGVSTPAGIGGGRLNFPWVAITNLSPTNDRTVLYWAGAGMTAPTGSGINTVWEANALNHSSRWKIGPTTQIMWSVRRSAAAGNNPGVRIILKHNGVEVNRIEYLSYTYAANIAGSINPTSAQYGLDMNLLSLRIEGIASSGGGGGSAQRTVVPVYAFFDWNYPANLELVHDALEAGGGSGGFNTAGKPDLVDLPGTPYTLGGYLLGSGVSLGKDGRLSMVATGSFRASVAWKATRPLRLRLVAENFAIPEWTDDWFASRRWTPARNGTRAVGWDTSYSATNPQRANIAEFNLATSPPTITIKNGLAALDDPPDGNTTAMGLSPSGQILLVGRTIPVPLQTLPADGALQVFKYDGAKFIRQPLGAVNTDIDFNANYIIWHPNGKLVAVLTEDTYYVINTQWSRHVVWFYSVDEATATLTFRVAYQIPNRDASTAYDPFMVQWNTAGDRLYVFYRYQLAFAEIFARSYLYIDPALTYDRLWTLEAEGTFAATGAGADSIWHEAAVLPRWSPDNSQLITFNIDAGVNLAQYWRPDFATSKIMASQKALTVNAWKLGTSVDADLDNQRYYRVPGTNAVLSRSDDDEYISSVYRYGAVAAQQQSQGAGEFHFAHRPQWTKPLARLGSDAASIALDESGRWHLHIGRALYSLRGWELFATSIDDPFLSLAAAGTFAARSFPHKFGKLRSRRFAALSRQTIYPLGSLRDTFDFNALDEATPANGWSSSGSAMVTTLDEAASDAALALVPGGEHIWDRARTATVADFAVALDARRVPASVEANVRVDNPDRVFARLKARPSMAMPFERQPDPDASGPLAGVSLHATGVTRASANGRFLMFQAVPHEVNRSTLNYRMYVYDFLTGVQHLLDWSMFGPYLPFDDLLTIANNGWGANARIEGVTDDGVISASSTYINNAAIGLTGVRYHYFAKLSGGTFAPYANGAYVATGGHNGRSRLWPDGSGATFLSYLATNNLLSDSGGANYLVFERYTMTSGSLALAHTVTIDLSARPTGTSTYELRPFSFCGNYAITHLRGVNQAWAWDANALAWVESVPDWTRGTYTQNWSTTRPRVWMAAPAGTSRLFYCLDFDPVTLQSVAGPYHRKAFPGTATPSPTGTSLTYSAMLILEPDWAAGRAVVIMAASGTYAGRVWWVNLATASITNLQSATLTTGLAVESAEVVVAFEGLNWNLLIEKALTTPQPANSYYRFVPLQGPAHDLELWVQTVGGTELIGQAENLALSNQPIVMVSADGTAIRAKAWPLGTPEPATWNVEGTTALTKAGAVSVRPWGAPQRVDHVAVGVNGYPAPVVYEVDSSELSLAATGALSIGATRGRVATLALPGAGALSIVGDVVVPPDIAAELFMTAVGSLAVHNARARATALPMAGVGSFALAGGRRQRAQLALAAAGTLAPIPALRSPLGVLALAGASSLDVTALRARRVSGAWAAAGSLGVASRASFARAQWAASGALALAGRRVAGGPSELRMLAAGTANFRLGPLLAAGKLAMTATGRLYLRASRRHSWSPEELMGELGGIGSVPGATLGVRAWRGILRHRLGAFAGVLDDAMQVRIVSVDGRGLVTRDAVHYLTRLYERGEAFEFTTAAFRDDGLVETFEAMFDPEVEPQFISVTPAGDVFAIDVVLLVRPAAI
jgi:hypothetical protein